MDVFSQMIIVGLAAAAGLAALALARTQTAQPRTWTLRSSGGKKPLGKNADLQTRIREPGPAERECVLRIEQLDPKTMQAVHSYDVTDIPGMGVSISRPNAARGSIKLDPAVREAYTVSQEHVRIGRDDAGIFIQDRKRIGRMCQADGGIVEELDITDGLVLYLGSQPLRFRIPGARERGMEKNRAAADTRRFGQASISEMTADTRIYMPPCKM